MQLFKTSLVFFLFTSLLVGENINLLPQGGFETDPNADGTACGWYLSNHSGRLEATLSKDCVQGNFSQQIYAKNAKGYLIGGFDSKTCFIQIEPGIPCNFSFYAKRTKLAAAVSLNWMPDDSFEKAIPGGTVINIDSDAWKKYEAKVVPPQKAKYALLQFWIEGEKEAGTVLIDDVRLEIVKKTEENQSVKNMSLSGNDIVNAARRISKGYHVADWNGAPAIFHEDIPISSASYFNCTWNAAEAVSPEAHDMLNAGVHIHHLSSGLDWGDRFASGNIEKEGSAYASLDSRIRAALKMDPHARFLLNVHTFVPRHWEMVYPSEIMAGEDGILIKEGNLRACNSFASTLWKEEVGKRIRALIRHMKSTEYYDSVIGLHSFVGWEGQWTWWLPDAQEYSDPAQCRKLAGLIADHSPAMTVYFREWARKKYNNDVDALRKNRDNPGMTFENITVPSEELITQSNFFLFKDPSCGKAKYVRDYFEAYRDCRLDALLYWGRVVKEETADSPKLYGSYYGSLLHCAVGGTRHILRHISGYRRLCSSSDIDYFISTPNYPTREIGGDGLNNLLNDSLLMHGKFLFYEQDQPTHLSVTRKDKSEDGRSSIPADIKETITILKRNFAYTLCKGRMGYWWWDQEASANKNNAVRYNAPEIWQTISKTSKIALESLKLDCSSSSEIAVFYSEKTNYYFSLNEWLPGRNLITKQVMPFGKTGAPYDSYEISDLPGIRPYKLYIFWNIFYLSDDEVKSIENKVKRNGSTVVWIYAPGYVGDSGLSVERMSKLMNIKMVIVSGQSSLLTDIGKRNHPITENITECREGVLTEPDTLKISTEKTGPFFYCNDTEAVVLGSFVSNGKPSLVVKEFPEWKSVYAGFYPLSSKFLRNIARYAGVHIYDSGDDVIYANKSYLCIHADKPGKRIIELPAEADVYDVFDEKYEARKTCRFTLDIEEPVTKLYRIDVNPKEGR